MRSAETLLNVLQDRGQRNLPITGLYRMLYNQTLYLRAYAKLYSNQGSLTPGSTDETADGMSLRRIDRIIEAVRSERYRWTAVRRVYIPKPDGRQRALGLPTWSDKLLQEVIRSLLEAYYEPLFSSQSHGFRPNLGPRSALMHIQRSWTGTKWWIEGDIESYFDSIDHEILLALLGRTINDNRFLNLIRRYLSAGHMDDWRVVHNQSGTPQGGVLSPLLSNIYLHELDVYATTELIPRYTRGQRRRLNPAYGRINQRQVRLRRKGLHAEAEALYADLRQLPSYDPYDPNYRRLRYIRYADDFLLGFAGPRTEALQIKSDISTFLRDHLNLELNERKTLITHARTQPARFLGYDLQTQHANDQVNGHRRRINGVIGLRVPRSTITNHAREYYRGDKIVHIPMLVQESDYSILNWYQARYRGIVLYYLLAYNVHHFYRLHYAMRTSLLKTLALKHRSSLTRMLAKYSSTVTDQYGNQLRCLEVTVPRTHGRPLVARFGGIPLRRDMTAPLHDRLLPRYTDKRSELLTRMLATTCELCDVTGVPIEVHHIRALKDLTTKGQTPKPAWAEKMAGMRRKTLMVCHSCHQDITHGRYDNNHAII